MHNNVQFSDYTSDKVLIELVTHVYKQLRVGLLSSLFCAVILFIGLHQADNNQMLYAWFGLFMLITVARLAFSFFFFRDEMPINRVILWNNLCTFGGLLGGFSWGIVGMFLFPDANTMQQMLTVLMIAGVTAGVVPLTSAVPSAAVSFLICSLSPLILSIALFKESVYLLFDCVLTVYLFYMISLSLKNYHLIRNSVLLQFDNDALLETLEEAKNNLEVANKKLEYSATHDPLTQVPNRNLLEAQLKEAMDKADAHGKKVALFYLDLDEFKEINDTHGHRVGDQYLVLMVQRLKNYFGGKDIVARLGGDEFTVIIENAEGDGKVSAIARELCDVLREPFQIKNLSLSSSVSIGIGFYPDNAEDVVSLLQCADKQMYVVKEHGGNNYHIAHELV